MEAGIGINNVSSVPRSAPDRDMLEELKARAESASVAASDLEIRAAELRAVERACYAGLEALALEHQKSVSGPDVPSGSYR